MLYLNNLPKLTKFYSSITTDYWGFSNAKEDIKIDNNINCSLYLNKWGNYFSEDNLQKWIGKSKFGFKTIYKNW